MNWVQQLWITIISSDNKPFIDKISLLETANKKLKYTQDSLNKDFDSCVDKISDLRNENTLLTTNIIDLKDQVFTLTPLEIKKPTWLTGKVAYTPKRRFVSKDYDLYFTFDEPGDVFDKSRYLYRLMKKAGYIGLNQSYAKANELHKWIVSRLKYTYDDKDNWRPVTETLLAKRCDCEDSAIVLCSTFGMAGWKDDEVFLGVGWYYPKGKIKDPENRFYHSWCNIKINGKWYISEGTNPRGSLLRWDTYRDKYELKEVWNWKFEGRLRSGKKYFNRE